MKIYYSWKKNQVKQHSKHLIIVILLALIGVFIISLVYLSFINDIRPINEINASKRLTIEQQIRNIAPKYADYLIEIAKCESSLNQYAIGDNGHSRGLYQIHDKWHPEVSNECAFDVSCATRYAVYLIKSGRQHEWTCN